MTTSPHILIKFCFMFFFDFCTALSLPMTTWSLRLRRDGAWSNTTNSSFALSSSYRTMIDQSSVMGSDFTTLLSPSSLSVVTTNNTSRPLIAPMSSGPPSSSVPGNGASSILMPSTNIIVTRSSISLNVSSTAGPGTKSWDIPPSSSLGTNDGSVSRQILGPSETSVVPSSSSLTPSNPPPLPTQQQPSSASASVPQSTAPPTPTSKITISPLPITTGVYSGLTQFLTFPGFSISGTSTVSGVTTHVATKTRGADNEETPVVIFFPCFGFCGGGGGGGGGGGFGILSNIGPAPGIYYPPGLPPFIIGTNGLPIPNPPNLPQKPTDDPEEPEKPSDRPSQMTTTPMPSSSLSSSSSCTVQTASACSAVCAGDSCTTTCSPIATACSATCSGTTCSQVATFNFAPMHSGLPQPYDWMAISEYDPTKASSVALAIEAMVMSWENEVDSMPNTTALPILSSTFLTSVQSSTGLGARNSTIEPSSTALSSRIPTISTLSSMTPSPSSSSKPPTSTPPSSTSNLPTATPITSITPSTTLISSTTSSTASPPPPPKPTPTRALSILLQREIINSVPKNSWLFFPTTRGQPADGCDLPLLNAQNWDAEEDLASPPWPQGTFDISLYNEECVYVGSASGPGRFSCPSMGERGVGCGEDAEKGVQSAVVQCMYSFQVKRWYHRVVFCEW